MQPAVRRAAYLRLFRNPAFMLLWSSQTVSSTGDSLFMVVVMWLVYSHTGSALQTGIIALLSMLAAILVGPVAGVYADRWHRKRTMVIVPLLSALIVGAAALAIALGHLAPALIYATVLLLTVAALFQSPARISVMPEIVGRDDLAAAGGLSSMVNQGTSLVGAGLAGLILAGVGAAWALIGDAVSFLAAAAAVATARIPGRAPRIERRERPSLIQELRDGWGIAQAQPVVRAYIRIVALVNAISYMGPIFPALVRIQLHGGVRAYGFLEAASVVGGIAGGLASSGLERRLGAGKLITIGFIVAGVCYAALGLCRSVMLGGVLLVIATFFLLASEVGMNALMPLLVPEEFRGRLAGILQATAVIALPATILLGGWLADRVGPGPLYVFGGLWASGVGLVAWTSRPLRSARITLPSRGGAA